MTKELTTTIYSSLASAFWTKRKCSKCQAFFTSADYQTQNYQLLFIEIGQIKSTTSLNYAVLEGVIVELSHQSCCSACTNYLQDLKKCSIPISKK